MEVKDKDKDKIPQKEKEKENSQNEENKINAEEKKELSLREELLNDYGFYANINGEDFDPREVTVLSGDEKNREITQIIKFLFDSYPVEAINYCLRRCYYKTFSRSSLLDKIIKYLLTKYEDKGEETIMNLICSYKENILNIDITTVNDFNNKNSLNFGNSILHMTKLVFYDYSKEGVEYKKFNINEIFIEIDSKCISNNKENKNEKEKNELTLEENDYQAMFLGDKHHLFKRFCRRKDNIYVLNFIGFENKKIKRNPNKKKKKYKKEKKEENNSEHDESCAIFECENEKCNAVYTYNFSSNKFVKREPHMEIKHVIKEDMPSYYQENIKLLEEKGYITDIQLVKVDE